MDDITVGWTQCPKISNGMNQKKGGWKRGIFSGDKGKTQQIDCVVHLNDYSLVFDDFLHKFMGA